MSETNKWASLSLEKIQHKIQNFEWNILDEKIPILDSHKLNTFFRFIESNLYFQSGIYGKDLSYFFGEGQFYADPYPTIYMSKEWLRSPNTVLSIAAVIGYQEIIIRKEALLYVYYQKWDPLLTLSQDQIDENRKRLNSISEEHVAELIRLNVRNLYQLYVPSFLNKAKFEITTENKIVLQNSFIFQEFKNTLVKDLFDIILQHELGHAVIQYHTLNLENATLAAALGSSYQNSLLTCLEILAEIAPSFSKIKGPLLYISNLAETDLLRARCLYWLYISDAWFYDTKDQHMYAYSDILIFIMQHYIQDKTIHFHRLLQDLQSKRLLSLIYDEVILQLNEVKPLCQVSLQTPLQTHAKPGSYEYQILYWIAILEQIDYKEIPVNPLRLLKSLYQYYGYSDIPRSIADHRRFLFKRFYSILQDEFI
jgi:hypothetical protein